MSSKPQAQESYQDKSKVATHPTKTHTTPNTQSMDTKNRETGKKERPDTHTSPENHRKSEPHKRTSRNPILGRPTDSRLPLRRTVAMTPDRTYGTNPALKTLRSSNSNNYHHHYHHHLHHTTTQLILFASTDEANSVPNKQLESRKRF